MLKYSVNNKDKLLNTFFELCKIIEENNYAINLIIKSINNTLTIPEDFINSLMKKLKLDRKRSAEAICSSLIFEDNICEYYWEKYIKGNFYTIDTDNFLNNPYIKNIKLNNISKHDNIHVVDGCYLKNEVLFINTLSRDRNFRYIPSLGIINHDIHFPVLKENHTTWMSIAPSEIITNKSYIDEMKGNILVFGLGLGYFSYMCSLKDNIKSITIVESNKYIIEIFKEYILPQFNSNIPIKIIEDDCKDLYVNKDFMNKFSSAFIDIWNDTISGIKLYGFFRENEDGLNLKISYWLERDMYNQLEDVLASYVLNINDLNNFKNAPEYIRVLYKKIKNYFKTHDYNILNSDDVFKLLTHNKILNDIFKTAL